MEAESILLRMNWIPTCLNNGETALIAISTYLTRLLFLGLRT
jgi:hypothetical protein